MKIIELTTIIEETKKFEIFSMMDDRVFIEYATQNVKYNPRKMRELTSPNTNKGFAKNVVFYLNSINFNDVLTDSLDAKNPHRYRVIFSPLPKWDGNNAQRVKPLMCVAPLEHNIKTMSFDLSKINTSKSTLIFEDVHNFDYVDNSVEFRDHPCLNFKFFHLDFYLFSKPSEELFEQLYGKDLKKSAPLKNKLK